MNSKLWIVIVLALVLAGAALADSTFVQPGNVSGNWTAVHSPYVIQGDVHVPAGQSLNISQGVRVYFDGLYRLEVDSLADFSANGAEADSVVFTTDTIAHPLKWGGIEMWYPADTVRLTYCIIEYMQFDTSKHEADSIAHQAALQVEGNICVVLSHSSLRYNTGAGWAGGMEVGGGYTSVDNCIFTGNYGCNGGALSILSNARLTNCRFEGNYGWGNGGAICVCFGNDSTSISDCLFLTNHTWGDWFGGGAISHFSGALRLVNCQFTGNFVTSSEAVGGAIWSRDPSDRPFIMLSLSRCSITDNTVPHLSFGGAICMQNGTVQNCTLARDSCGSVSGILGFPSVLSDTIRVVNTIVAFSPYGSGIWLGQGSCMVRNCLIFGNPRGSGGILNDSLFGRITHTNANGDSCDAYQNLFLDPMFVDTTSGNYHLLANSPCIDAGDPNSPHDPDGTIADIGAFYYNQLGARDQFTSRPSAFILSAFPNPFNAVTRISFSLPCAGEVKLDVYDITGRLAARLVDRPLAAGAHEFAFDGKSLASGIYFVRLKAGDVSQTRKIVLIR